MKKGMRGLRGSSGALRIAALLCCAALGPSCKSSNAPAPTPAATDSGRADATAPSHPDATTGGARDAAAQTNPDAQTTAPPIPPGEDGPGVYPPVPRIIAIGDVHGDGSATLKVLEGTGVIDADQNWAAGTTWVVQVGDQLDRGYQEEEILRLFDKLRDQARAAGGRFLALNGNHEIMQAEGDLRYVFDEQAFGGLDARRRSFAPGGEWAKVLAKRNVIVQVGRTVFVHGGALPGHARVGIESMNADTKAWLEGDLAQQPTFVDGSGSIVWDRTYSDDDPDDIVANRCEILDEVLRVLDADRIVVAHTVQPRVNSICDGKAWRIDTGIASYYGSNLQAIEIADGFVNTITVR